ncbi:MAG: glycoside hydrolase family 3 N-terminal domain-containing protein [Christensenella sp.]
MKCKMMAVLLCAVLLFAGCADAGQDTASVSPTVVAAEEDSPQAPEAVPTPTVAPKVLSGMVTASDENGISLQNEDGQKIDFVCGEAALDIIALGSTAEVTYTQDGDKYKVQSVSAKTPPPNPPFNLYEARAKEILAEMTLEEKVGQMFFARCPAEDADEVADKYQPGGYVLFDRDFKDETKDEVKDSIAQYQQASKIGMLIGVDEEGGTVKRVSKYKALCDEPFLSPQALYEKGGIELIVSDTKKKADVLKDLGINVNLAPVCDVSTDPENFIYKRAFGKEAEETAKYVSAVVTQMNESGIGCTLKHFPGYGSNVDTHTGIADDKRSYDSFVANDFIPFSAGIAANAGSVLVCHNIVESIDGDYPASLSAKAHDVLRNTLGFSGVIMTDDLYMEAIRDEYGVGQAAVMAVQAGNDLLLSSQFEDQYAAVLAAAQDGTLSEDTVNGAVTRVLCWKLTLGIAK